MGEREADGVLAAADDPAARFAAFVEAHGNRIWQAVVPIAGTDIAADSAADALAYGWEHWDRVSTMVNPAGYLYAVARSRALRRAELRSRSTNGTDAAGAALPRPDPALLPEVEPGLAAALLGLSEMQRQTVLLVEGFGWGLTDTARMLDISVSTVRNHLARALARLRVDLKVDLDG